MPVAHFLENYLSRALVDYNLVPHRHTESAYDSARAAHVPIGSVVKAVLLRDCQEESYVLALLPASNKLKPSWVEHELKRDMKLADEEAISDLFPDCAFGAIPGFGQAYNLDVIWDNELAQQARLYFEAGDHEALVQISQIEFLHLFRDFPRGDISEPCGSYSALHDDEARGTLH